MAFRCNACGNVYSTMHNLKRHVNIQHEALRFPCGRCIKIYTTKFKRDNHMERQHGIKKTEMIQNHACPECGKNYVKTEGLLDHIDAEHLKIRYPCPFCEKEFKFKNILVRHRNKCHQDDKFNYDYEEGKDNWEFVEKNCVPFEVLPEDYLRSIKQYLNHCNKYMPS